MAFAGGIVAAVAAMLFAVVDQLEQARRQRAFSRRLHFRGNRAGCAVHALYIVGQVCKARKAWRRRQAKLHGRVEGARDRCAVPGCDQPGEFKAPLAPANFDGPGSWRFLCLDHVREHNARYNFFDGMSAEEISRGAVADRRVGAAEPRRSPPSAPTRRRRGATSPIRWMPSARASRTRRAARRHRRGSTAPNGARCRCSASAKMPTAMRCASAIRCWSAAITPTRMAATAATKRSSAR